MSSATTTYSMILGSLMAQQWEERGLKQQDFFAKSGIATGTWSRIMCGQAHFQIEDIRTACRALGCKVAELTAKADEIEVKLEHEEDVTVASKAELQEKGSALPAIIAAAALGFLLYRLLKQ